MKIDIFYPLLIQVISPFKTLAATSSAGGSNTSRPSSSSSVLECEICCLSLPKQMMTGEDTRVVCVCLLLELISLCVRSGVRPPVLHPVLDGLPDHQDSRRRCGHLHLPGQLQDHRGRPDSDEPDHRPEGEAEVPTSDHKQFCPV